MKILVINSGSSSLKYQLFDMDTAEVLAKGLCERIGAGAGGMLKHVAAGKEIKLDLPMDTHLEALQAVMQYLTSPEYGVLQDIREIDAVGHRLGHGGPYIDQPRVIDETVKADILRCFVLAPLHNPPAYRCIEACETLFGPDILQTVVCDTGFHGTIPEKAYTFGLPRALCLKHQVRRYGFHGMSHQYVAREAARFIGRREDDCNVIICHLGSGASVAAVKNGVSREASTGFQGVAGLMMGTRSGDVDPVVIPYLMEKEGLSIEEMNEILYKKSGLLGISGVSADLRDIEAAAGEGNADAALAIEMFAHQIKRFVGAYIAVLNGAHAIAFTAGIGENSHTVRRLALSDMDRLGIHMDEEKNRACPGGVCAEISADGSPVKVLVIPTNEELMIANETLRLAGENR